jgi:hypothetical protein
MFNQVAQIATPVWLAIAAICLLLLCRPGSTRRLSGGYRSHGLARSFDECFPEQPTTVRHGIVCERNEVMLPQYTLSAVRSAKPTMVPHYAFTIICHDVAGGETLKIVAQKDAVNVFAESGRPVEVVSTRNRLDYDVMVHRIAASDAAFA